MRIADRAFVLATILIAASGCESLSARNQNRHGNTSFRDGMFPDAVAHYEKALKTLDDPVVHFNIGLAYQKVFKAGYDKPIMLAFQDEDVCSNIPNTKPVEARVCVKEHDRHYNGNECDDKTPCPALSTCTKATFCTLMAKQIADTAGQHLQVWLKVQPPDDAIKAEIKKVEANINELNERAEPLRGKEDSKAEVAAIEDHIKDLQKDIEELGTKKRIRSMMTQMWIDSDQFDKALGYWTDLLKDKPNDPDIMGTLAGINLNAGDWRKSIEWYLKVAATSTDTAGKVSAYQFIGNVAWSKLNSHALNAQDSLELADRGIGALGKAAELQPENGRPLALAASLYNFRALTSGASWAAACDRAQAQDLLARARVLNAKAKKAESPATPTPPPTGAGSGSSSTPSPAKAGG